MTSYSTTFTLEDCQKLFNSKYVKNRQYQNHINIYEYIMLIDI